MITFDIIKRSSNTRARLGILKTPHGEVETPSLVPVATQAVVKTLDSEEVLQTKSQILIANTFHLHLKPGVKIIKDSGGIHHFMNWPKTLMTDSGGFQVFSLGFGKDLKVGKILKFFPTDAKELVDVGNKPQDIKITFKGVQFRSPFDGQKIFLGPKESIKIQEAITADIIFAFDECTPPLCTINYAKVALDRTHHWAKICIDSKKSNQALFGIVQGSKYQNLRELSAKYINSLGFDGYGIGGDLGESKDLTVKIINWSIIHLDENKPRHLLGIGHLEDIELIIKNGIDLFDCTVPTQYARHGAAFTSEGKLDLNKKSFLNQNEPLDKKCDCYVCQEYKRNYLSHLVRAKEITGLKLLTFHNLFFFNTYVEKIRQKIKEGKL
ncbi:tRNA guanosine(34) transglycosylase Tgt [Candidatus Gottesmanbacteria bacterium]|nr:tRNA guanosine(34) transglycosylase Tgt [Candidatus Gottesmanbacteria bacterium]